MHVTLYRNHCIALHIVPRVFVKVRMDRYVLVKFLVLCIELYEKKGNILLLGHELN